MNSFRVAREFVEVGKDLSQKQKGGEWSLKCERLKRERTVFKCIKFTGEYAVTVTKTKKII